MNDLNKKKVLIVDDDPNIVLLIERILNMEQNCTIDTAYDGEEALKKARESLPDIILMDIMMPKLDGLEVCKALKTDEKTQFIPIVLITGLSQKEDRIAGIEAGADDFLTKPIDKRELIVRTKSLLRIKSLHDELYHKNMLLNKILTRYVADDIYNLILQNPDKHLKLGGDKKNAAVLFVDIRGFTAFSEQFAPETIVEFLNDTFAVLIKVIFKYKGTFGKYLGDGLMAYYHTPADNSDSVMRAISTAVEMQQLFGDLREQFKDEKFAALGMGIGINSGNVIMGNIGSEKMMEYTIIGDTVNVAKGLQEFAHSDQILISGESYEAVRGRIAAEKISEIQIKGRQHIVQAYELRGTDKPVT
ncbi:MAG: adenylate/guanylate cyclase domain-containing protein [Elusimicrobiota bacterium]